MTAYARESREGEWGRAIWELRSVNHRFLELSLYLPEEFRLLEGAFREQIGAVVRRGKVDAGLRFEPAPGAAAATYRVNLPLAEGLKAAATELNQCLSGTQQPLSAVDLLRWPGMIEVRPPDPARLATPLAAALDRALVVLAETRQREGEKIRALLLARCDAVEGEIRRVRAALPEIMEAQRARLLARIAEAAVSVDPGRLEQELVFVAQRLDVAEELDRIGAHLEEVRRVLDAGEPSGRRLDFLMQELNREANTLGSKSVHLTTTAASVELKVLIEQMREQVQNLE
jgi:uncharacterized protein (TIGR00255 family)